ncbi:MAG: hypothetical protein U1F87_10485 [Kiritimatiellia bacterium]
MFSPPSSPRARPARIAPGASPARQAGDAWSIAQASFVTGPEIDGLRTVAILPVIPFHLNPVGCRGASSGSTFLFVISGFLITRSS